MKTREEREPAGFLVFSCSADPAWQWLYSVSRGGVDEDGDRYWPRAYFAREMQEAAVFETRRSAERARAIAGSNAVLVELRYTDERWQGQDREGRATAWLCERCLDLGESECAHRGSKGCFECGQVRPIEWFVLGRDIRPDPLRPVQWSVLKDPPELERADLNVNSSVSWGFWDMFATAGVLGICEHCVAARAAHTRALILDEAGE